MSTVSEFTPQDYELIAREYAELREAASRRCANQKELDVVQKAFDFANEAHKGVRRRSGEPYIIHPIEVAKIVVSDIGLGYKSIVAALLHDVVEDTEYTVEDIRNLFGDKIASLVDGLTKIKTVLDNEDKTHQMKSLQAENFKRILLTLNDDVRVVLIKLADRLHNCRTIEFMPEHKRDKILSETMFVFIPLAHRLGLYSIKSEMEDIWLRYKEPQAFNDIQAKINRNVSDKEKQVDEFVESINELLDKMGIRYTVKKRVKSPYSIWHKMQTKNITFEQVYDLYAVRIIFEPKTADDVESERAQCYAIFVAITDKYDFKEDRFRDWIRQPKNNGYEALHCTVMSKSGIWIEVQIRSKRMDDIAEKGIAAHWAYKREGIVSENENEMDKWIAKVQEILMNPDVNALELLDIIHNDLTASEILVFTPKGEQKSIMKGATALDFAYMIHTHIGNKAIAAKVNLRLEPLSYVLRSGDQVEIITAQTENPKREWLDFLKTRKAIGVVSDYFDKIDKQKAAEEAAQKQKSGKWTLTSIFRPRSKSEYIINDSHNTENQFVIATCCHPIPGDPVVGFIDSKGVITVHKKTCEVANSLAATHGDSIVSPKWEAEEDQSFVARISLNGIDRVGLLNEITKYISLVLKVNLRRLVFESTDTIFTGEMDLMVHDKDDLNRLIKKLSKIDGIQKVVRKDV